MEINDLEKEFQKYNYSITKTQAIKFIDYYNMILQWNTKFNLTRIVDEQETIQKHFLDSILPIFNKINLENSKCIDIGSGAGFPAIPLLIICKNIQITMIDSSKKRVAFLEEAIKTLSLNANAVHARAEDAAKDRNMREKYDFSLSRAVAPVAVIGEYSAAFLKIGGSAIMYKGPNAKSEALNSSEAFNMLGLGEIEFVETQTQWGERVFVVCKKNKQTPIIFPRARAIIDRKPLA